MNYRRPRLLYFGPMSVALLKGRKTSVRVPFASRRSVAFQPGELVPAYDQRPKRGGKPIAMLRITDRPYRMNSADATEEDYEIEGFAYLEEQGQTFGHEEPRRYWEAAKAAKADVCVIRFQVVDILVDAESDIDQSEDNEGLAMLGLRFMPEAIAT